VSNPKPFATRIDLRSGLMSGYERHTLRRLSDMPGYFHASPADEDPLIYEYFERDVPPEDGQIVQNVSILHPGAIDGEYHMTKGHYHANRRCSEVYLCLSGRGVLLMQTRDGETGALTLERGISVYVPPGWAHRSVNTGDQPLVLFALYPADSGHDYAAIAEQGFWARVIRGAEGRPLIVPRSGGSG
jgi:glucose-6-phosphate isomerase